MSLSFGGRAVVKVTIACPSKLRGIPERSRAPVVQWIGHFPAKEEMQVRFLPRGNERGELPREGASARPRAGIERVLVTESARSRITCGGSRDSSWEQKIDTRGINPSIRFGGIKL